MTLQTINLGNYANDGTGDDLRTAFQKVNANFIELGGTVNIANANNLGNGSGIFAQRTFANLEFKSLTSNNNNVIFTETDNELDINALTILENDPAPMLGADMGLNGHTIKAINGGGIESKIWGIDIVALNSLVSLMLESNASNIDMGSFITPTGLSDSIPKGYILDMGSIIEPNGSNNINFGLIQ